MNIFLQWFETNRCFVLPALLLLVFGAGAAPRGAHAQDEGGENTDAGPLTLVVSADQGETTISRHIYGHFAEHLGRDIYGGFWVQEDGSASGPPSGWQYNDEVIEALRQIDIPNLRWPGGCFADYYHWRDGIGPRAERPSIVNTIWGGVTEDNSFGTHEYMGLVERLDTEPFVVGNVGSGTVEEMANWWEYINHPAGSPMANLRGENGRSEPWAVRYWGVGNESWGCGGSMTPSYYADLYKRFATFLRPIGGTEPFRVATGPSGDDYAWTRTLMEEAGGMIDGLDLHYYTVVGTWEDKGAATDFTEGEWFTAMQKALYVDELISRHSAIMDQYDPEQNTALIVGEWGMWHDVEPGTEPGFLYQQNALRDALVAAVHLNVFNQHADRVRMANIAQTVNVLQAMVLTKGEEMIVTPTYHVFDMFKVHQDATLLPTTLEAGRYEHDGEHVPALSASASRDEEGRLHLTLANMDPNVARALETEIRGADVSEVAGRILTAEQMSAHNTFESPQAVEPAPFDGVQRNGQTLSVELPPKSVVVLELR